MKLQKIKKSDSMNVLNNELEIIILTIPFISFGQ